MALISLQEVSIGFGGPPLLDKVNLQIEQGEWIGLLGRNGMGKSTLLKLVNDDIAPQSGIIARQQDLCTAYLPQEVPAGITGKVFDIVAGGLDSLKPVPASDEHHWRGQLQVEQVISRMQLDGEARFEILSAGMKRRVMLARGLVRQPELLLLDEPTNHLDIASIDWLEGFLKRWGGTLLFVTHDRVFLQKLTSRIVELDRGHLFDWNCNYTTFLERRDAMLSAEAEQNALFDKKLAQEEVWIRKGIEARRTRNEGRVRALKRLREQRKERRERPGKVKMQIQSEARSGKIVIEAENVSYAYDGRSIVKEFTTTIQRGDKIGIIGPNGSGKTTLLRLLLEELTPQTGTVEHGTNIEIGYFDQLRAQLDETKSVLDNVGQGSDNVTINGRSRNLNVYLEDFLFSRDRINAPISALSGGERNRLMLARLFAQPANLLVMDEPTNDLDVETLEILEELLLDYEGTLLLVSHDRAFLNNIVTSTLALDGSGRVIETVGGYDDWARQNESAPIESKPRKAATSLENEARSSSSKKPSYKEQRAIEAQKRELAELPQRIEKLEADLHALTAEMSTPNFYQRDSAEIAQTAERLKQMQDELNQAYARWEELEMLKD